MNNYGHRGDRTYLETTNNADMDKLIVTDETIQLAAEIDGSFPVVVASAGPVRCTETDIVDNGSMRCPQDGFRDGRISK